MPQDIADTLFSTTPRTVVAMVFGLISFYGILLTQFASTDSVEILEIALKQQETTLAGHIEQSTLQQSERVLEDVSDKRWQLKQQIIEAQKTGADTSELLNRDHYLQKREKKHEKRINCIKMRGKHCMTTSDT